MGQAPESTSQLALLAEGVSFVARPEQVRRLGEHWVSLTARPLTILVGVTGVGKSTTLARLRARGLRFGLLPDRRVVADAVIIGTLQMLDGQPLRPVTDRVKRLEYTARYRKLFGGGVAHALTRLVIRPEVFPEPLLFDGLRGREEVAYAVDHLPHSRYIVLHAPDEVRVSRLLGRADAFDQTAVTSQGDTLAALQALPGIEQVFSREQVARLAALAPEGEAGEQLVKQVAIVVAERRNYDPEAARAYLTRHLPPDRLLMVDTARDGPDTVVRRIEEWWG